MLLKDLIVSPCNVRQNQDDTGIEELKDSIKEYTLISKIILRPGDKGKYEIVAGRRRYHALLALLGEDHELPPEDYIFMENLDDEKAFLLSISENTQRLDLSPIELNKAALKLNSMGYKDKKIAKILNITPYRLKRICQLSQDMHKIPESARQELLKPVEESKFNDAHWDKVRTIENEDVVKDVVDYIIEKETPPKDVPTIAKAIEKQYEKDNPLPSDAHSSAPISEQKSDSPPVEGPIEYAHKGEIKLELHGDERILKVLGKGEDEEIPIEHYMQYLLHPEKFRCFVTFKLKVKPVD
jgi:ParB/RepB/Spo0J family partition protein